ncbi:PLP-dependent transferase [Karstenula rhodostoma CBS 690.94]|uniref:PLP-dependent transferase n=1 Tax=Karstenula rhodostoma CBS 690.94 TaxID=1392251 RepID=A0A9P4PP25_9PLEO|nr:PLP-dependent transferase [Karstenula rhodostoma CBS 690.94]
MMSLTGHLSERGHSNVEAIMPKIKGAVGQRNLKANANIDLSTAENWLIRPELTGLCKTSIVENLSEIHFSYPIGFSGDPDLLEAYASFFNSYFHPHRRVEPSHLAVAPGASGCIDSLLYNICDPGDGILLPGPYWNGFDFGLRARVSVTPVLVSVPTLDAGLTSALIPALEEALKTSTCSVKALMITNPHNPLALCYPKTVLENCLRFCQKHKIHFISDEVYALSIFPNPEMPTPIPFTSVLSLDLVEMGVDTSRVHMVWSLSKDLGQSGFRMGCMVSQSNQEMSVGLALASMAQISGLSTVFTTALLKSPELLSLLALNSRRLSIAYATLTGFLKSHDIPYIPCNAGIYVFARMCPAARSWEDEASFVDRLKESGVLVSPGRAYHGPESEKGWMRVGFAVQPSDLAEALRRMESVYDSSNRNLSVC